MLRNSKKYNLLIFIIFICTNDEDKKYKKYKEIY